MNSIHFDTAQTKKLKGVALILMLVHHTSMCAEWEKCSVEIQKILYFQMSSTKMCVWIFAFLVGYGFFCSTNKTVQYSFKRILMLLIPFWTMMLFMFIPLFFLSNSSNILDTNIVSNIIGGGKNHFVEIVYNLFGISESLNWYSWFVFFYILTILAMPFLHRFYMRFPKFGWLVSILGFYGLTVLIHTFLPWSVYPILQNVFTFTSLVPVVIVGYMCAYWNSQGLIPKWFEGKHKWHLSLMTILLVLVIQALRIPTMGFCIQAFYTPFLIFAIIGIFNSYSLNVVRHFLLKVGDLSMYMWFFHAVFFTETVNLYTKNLVMEPFHSFPYTLLMTFVLTYLGSWCFKKLLTPIMNKIK